MNQPEVPPVFAAPPVIPHPAISYDLTRGDLFINNLTIFVRKRFLQILLLVALVINTFIIFVSKAARQPLTSAVWGTAIEIGVLAAILIGVHALFSLAVAFLLPHKGVVCRHTLEITDAGLIERTDVNESLHRWAGMANIMRACGSLYIYVSDFNCHQVPIRGFAPGELEAFEAELRRRVMARR